MTVILTLCLLLGRVVVHVKQAPVVGEMLAGLLLGPSFFGWLAPSWFARLFPADSFATLELLSQICLIVFMFFLGRRVSASSHHTGLTTRTVLVLGIASMAAPLALGLVLGSLLYAEFAPPGITALPFVLFIGAALSMTAFPVLARIIEDFKLMGTRLGTTAIACAALYDLAGWTMLAGILTLLNAGGGAAVLKHVLLFAAFLGGVTVPARVLPNRRWLDRIERTALPLMLPLFFAFTGLRTRVQLINTADLWNTTAIIVATAIVGKAGFSAAAASIIGLPRREAWSLGVLLNTRGLIELVILSIGLDVGILSPRLYSMLVVMTFVTTFMTSPLLAWLLGAVDLKSSTYRTDTRDTAAP
jgi:Kef-type K+ transport system membrane component KefB